MVQRARYVVDYTRNGWAVLYASRGGKFNTENVYDTKSEAVNKARKAARTDEMPSKLTVTNMDGSYSEESNYDAGEPSTKRGGRRELTGGVYGGQR